DRRKDDRRKDDRRKDDRRSEGWRNDGERYTARGKSRRKSDDRRNDDRRKEQRGGKEYGSVKQRRPDRENREKVRQEIYFGKKETGKPKKNGGAEPDFEKSLLEEIGKLRELPFTTEEHFKKKSFRDYRTSAEEENGKKSKAKSTYREEPFKKKKNWFDRFRRKKKK
ncbi:MAG: hypothetical protein LWX07_12190, partial [Bacteroidetes bacterium]|nr:hypothetical protein [Bacteroidota bacterium]